ncbi:vacuolar protein sorting-associated protein 11 homolog [Lycorma delicatula]|uniref:vacuolar protein sorting-associated protein 11 homolog n=1 Tax=Lycorma delicatula TaxID=130591 RepID=UPI003F51484E
METSSAVPTILDSVGCSPHCSVLMDSVKDSHFICRNDAIYCYTTDGLGPCYAIDGEKIMLQWFRCYLVIVAKESKQKSQNSTTPPIGNQGNTELEPTHHTLTVLDIQNKFIVFSVPLKEVQAVLTEWGSFYIVTGSHSMYQLAEKDLQSKLALLFKKNLYDVSIRIAKNHQYDTEGLIDIFRQYGDHLYSKGDHNGAIEQYIKTIGSLEPSYVIRKAVKNINRYGGILLEKAPKETTQFLKRLCTDYKPSVEQNINNELNPGTAGNSAPPENFIHLFVNNSESLVDFLEHLVQNSNKWGTLIYNTLIEHYLQIWYKLSDTMNRLQYEQKIMRLLESLYQQILQYHLCQKDYQNVIICCRRFGNQDSSLWIQAPWAGARNPNVPPYLLNEILGVIEKERLLSPLEVVDTVCSWKSVKISDVRSYLNSVLQSELKTADHEQALIEKYTQETARIRDVIKSLQNSPVTFQGSRCKACNNQLELPSVHFLCQHSFHQHCFQSFSEHDNECPACLPNNKKILDVIRAQDQNHFLQNLILCKH